jgi:outer membrane immunogenic protein
MIVDQEVLRSSMEPKVCCAGTQPCLGLGICTSNGNWLATLSGRFGGVVADRTLVYVKGGAAWLQSDHSLSFPPAFGPFPTTSGGTTDFSKKSISLDLSPLVGVASTTGTIDVKEKLPVAKVGVNYKF